MAEIKVAIAPERHAGWSVAIADAGGLITATVPAVPGTGVPVLDSILALVTPLAATGDRVEVVIELFPGDESYSTDIAVAVMRELTAAGIHVDDDPTYLRRARVVEGLTVAAADDQAPDFLALAVARGCPPNASEGQAMAVLLARAPAAVWRRRSSLPSAPGRSLGRPMREVPPDREQLSIHEIVIIYGISRAAAYDLRRRIRSYRFYGVRFRRAEVEAFLESTARPPEPLAESRIRAGMSLASLPTGGDDEEVLPGLTRGELKKKAGF